jgi:phage gpG-like protein
MPTPGVQMEITAALESFKFQEGELRHLLGGPTGAVCRDLVRRAIRVEAAAKQNASQPPRAGPGSGSEPGHGPAVRTGRLRGSITWRLGADAISPYVDIGSNVSYSIFVEIGTSRMSARPYLRPAMLAARA